jgi:hypothetical protein
MWQRHYELTAYEISYTGQVQQNMVSRTVNNRIRLTDAK